ncbi:MAG TPA: S1C family serine protease, partial [Allocoleopsis sp.]
MFWRTRRRWTSLLLTFFVPTLILVQQPYSRGSEAQLTAEQIVALSTKPAVVRIENFCAANFKYEDKSEQSFTYGGLGSGFFVNPNGYIVTYAVKTEATCKAELLKQAKKNGKNPEITEDGDDFFLANNV